MLRFVSIHIFLSLVTYLDVKLLQMDVKTIFLSDNIEEQIYIDQPIGFVSKGLEDKVCHLRKSIYNLK